MIDIVRIISVGLIGTFLAITLKQQRPEISIAIALATGAAIFFISFQPLFQIVDMLREFSNRAGIDHVFFTIILRIIGISYLTQLASSVATDSGQTAIAAKIDFAGKMCIVVLSIPILKGIFDLLIGMVTF